ncbi:hypothetical protein KQH49_04520 [Mycetohabitans sp. B5]|uniref:Insecticidal toxin complex protein TccC n=1 Tax=Mycetohabitans endofungorum TaxID=417203 RepID=A0A2P5K7Y8_9BURK|nr:MULTISPECIES: hypothetical protein [Mycetohabitans]MCG1054266.1 hypothetical protein [Mycetohabitans sp. B5]PPB82822.1 hypothetical protein B0O95_11395 [Mycetohabitans endofungorum]
MKTNVVQQDAVHQSSRRSSRRLSERGDESTQAFKLAPIQAALARLSSASQASHDGEQIPYQQLAAAFQEGDIVYGLDAPRKRALDTLKQAGFSNLGQGSGGTQKRDALPPKRILIQNDLTNAVWDPLDKPYVYQSDKRIKKTLADAQRGIAFKTFLSRHPRYNVASEVKPSQQLTLEVSKALWKKTSKAGLEYQLLVRQKNIHFIVDDIDENLSAVAGKIGHGTSITSSELRWLYRHQKTEQVKQRVRFWKEDREVPHYEIFNSKKWRFGPDYEQMYRPKQSYWHASWLTSARPPRPK